MDITRDSLLGTVTMLARGISRRKDIQGVVATTTVTEVAINTMNISQIKGTVIDPLTSPIRVIHTDIMANKGERRSGIIVNSCV